MGLPLLDRWIGLAAFHILQRLPGVDVSSVQVQGALAANPLLALLTLGGVLSAAIARLITTWGIYRGEGVILLVGTSLNLLGQTGMLLRPTRAVLQQPGMVAVVCAGAFGLRWS